MGKPNRVAECFHLYRQWLNAYREAQLLNDLLQRKLPALTETERKQYRFQLEQAERRDEKEADRPKTDPEPG